MELRKVSRNIYVLPGSPNTTIKLLDIGGRAVVVDPGSGDDRVEAIMSMIERLNTQPGPILITHGHGDHIEVLPDLVEQGFGPVYASRHCLPAIENTSLRQVLVYGSKVPSTIPLHKPIIVRVNYWFTNGPVPGFTAKMIGGHSPGHAIFIDDENSVVVAGDALFGERVLETYGVPFATDLRKYVENLETILRDYAKQGYTIIPGHGPIVRGNRALELVEANINAAKRVIEKVLEALNAGEKTMDEIVVYVTETLTRTELTPRQLLLNRTTIASALAWLAEDGKVEFTSTRRGIVWKRKT